MLAGDVAVVAVERAPRVYARTCPISMVLALPQPQPLRPGRRQSQRPTRNPQENSGRLSHTSLPRWRGAPGLHIWLVTCSCRVTIPGYLLPGCPGPLPFPGAARRELAVTSAHSKPVQAWSRGVTTGRSARSQGFLKMRGFNGGVEAGPAARSRPMLLSRGVRQHG